MLTKREKDLQEREKARQKREKGRHKREKELQERETQARYERSETWGLGGAPEKEESRTQGIAVLMRRGRRPSHNTTAYQLAPESSPENFNTSLFPWIRPTP